MCEIFIFEDFVPVIIKMKISVYQAHFGTYVGKFIELAFLVYLTVWKIVMIKVKNF